MTAVSDSSSPVTFENTNAPKFFKITITDIVMDRTNVCVVSTFCCSNKQNKKKRQKKKGSIRTWKALAWMIVCGIDSRAVSATSRLILIASSSPPFHSGFSQIFNILSIDNLIFPKIAPIGKQKIPIISHFNTKTKQKGCIGEKKCVQ